MLPSSVHYFEAEDNIHLKRPRREFQARGSRVKRCDSCMMASWTCLCDHIPRLNMECEFWMLTHHEERYKPTNTGRLILMAHPESQGYIWHRTQPAPEFLQQLKRDDIQPYIVFPDDAEGYRERVHYQVKEWDETTKRLKADGNKKVAFILLDATWRQARKMFRLSEYLQDIPVLSLTPERVSEFMLRKEYSEQHLCTAEVAVNLLELTGLKEQAENLDEFYQRFNQHYIDGRMNRLPQVSNSTQSLPAD